MTRVLCGFGALFLALVMALAPLIVGIEEVSIPAHHLLHALMLAFAMAAALLLAHPAGERTRGTRVAWLCLAILAPLAAMALMWPSDYSWFETHPEGHALEHLGLVACGFATAYAGQRYARGVGWAAGLTLLFMALVSALGFGVAPPPAA